MPDSDVSRMIACVFSRSGAYGSSTLTPIAAWLFVGQLDARDRADRPPADLDVVARHELAGVLEHQRVLVPAPAHQQQVDRQRRDERDTDQDGGAGERHAGVYSMPSGPCEAPDRNCRTNWLSESKSSSAGPDSTIRPFHSTAMYSATRLADMMSWVITT